MVQSAQRVSVRVITSVHELCQGMRVVSECITTISMHCWARSLEHLQYPWGPRAASHIAQTALQTEMVGAAGVAVRGRLQERTICSVHF